MAHLLVGLTLHFFLLSNSTVLYESMNNPGALVYEFCVQAAFALLSWCICIQEQNCLVFCGNSVFSLLTMSQMVYSGCAILHSHQQYFRRLISPYSCHHLLICVSFTVSFQVVMKGCNLPFSTDYAAAAF